MSYVGWHKGVGRGCCQLPTGNRISMSSNMEDASAGKSRRRQVAKKEEPVVVATEPEKPIKMDYHYTWWNVRPDPSGPRARADMHVKPSVN